MSARGIVRLRERAGDALLLICFPHAGGRGAAFRALVPFLPRSVGLVAVDLPGRAGAAQERPFEDVEAAVTGLLPRLAPWLDGPFALVGHSVGALLAFEIAHRLAAGGGPIPRRVVVAGCRDPASVPQGEALSRLPRADLLRYLDDLGGMPPEVLANEELLDLMLPPLRADLALADRYVYRARAPLPCPLWAFGGTRDREVPPSSLAAWGRETAAGFRYAMLEGDHFFPLADPAGFVGAIVPEGDAPWTARACTARD
ncbi:thioesterase II family protein [Methylobacterium sp. sgz302541]|uniref:thioesterase II family protein n=1 Tax=unclassified Methylobacterium TaxID=2615210 RepID=UPI003D3405A9